MPNNIIFILTLCLSLITIVMSSHFLGGTINWRIENATSNGTSVAIRITQTYSWTYVTGRCDGTTIANNAPVAGGGGTTLACSPSCPAGFGSVSTTPLCTDVSSLNGISIGQRSDVVIIPEGSMFSAIYTGGSWGSLVIPASSWSILTYINLVRRPDNGMFNNAPVATIMSPINIVLNQRTSITVTVTDADGDITRCRWATASNGVDECGTVCPPGALPTGTVIHPNCTIEITGTVLNGRYAIALMAEDFIDGTSTQPLSSVPLQFLVRVINPSACSTPPEVHLTGSSCTPVIVNQIFTSQLIAINNCGANISIADIATLSFAGMNKGPLTQLTSMVYFKTITWTPTMNQLGYQVMCAMAVDSANVQSTQTCFSFYVTLNGSESCPGFPNSTVTFIPPVTNATTVTTTTTTTTTTTATTTTEPTSVCINWLLIGSLAGLLALATALSSCLLCRYHPFCIKQRQKFRLETAKISSSNCSVGTSTDCLSNMKRTKNYKPTVQRVKLTDRKSNLRKMQSAAIDNQIQNSLNNIPRITSVKTINNSLNESTMTLDLSTNTAMNSTQTTIVTPLFRTKPHETQSLPEDVFTVFSNSNRNNMSYSKYNTSFSINCDTN